MPSRSIDHALVLDAGSSGTRIYIYRWERWEAGDSAPPNIEIVKSKKQDGGIAKMIGGSESRYKAMIDFEMALCSALTQAPVQAAAEGVVQTAVQGPHLNTILAAIPGGENEVKAAILAAVKSTIQDTIHAVVQAEVRNANPADIRDIVDPAARAVIDDSINVAINAAISTTIATALQSAAAVAGGGLEAVKTEIQTVINLTTNDEFMAAIRPAVRSTAHAASATENRARAKATAEATFGLKDFLQSKIDAHLKPLFDFAKEYVDGVKLDPKTGVKTYIPGDKLDPKTIPLFLLGTAGIRDLCLDKPVNPGNEVSMEKFAIGRRQYEDLLRCMTASSKKAGYVLKECGAISGEAEALYGWVAANYSLGFFSGYGLRSSKTVGYLEMGGASAQIAFSPYRANPEIPYDGDIWKVRIGSLNFDLFLGSYALGMDLALHNYRERLVRKHVEAGRDVTVPIKDPATRIGLKDQKHGEHKLQSGGRLLDLSTRAREVLQDTQERFGTSEEQNTRLVAALQAHNFVGGANFWYSTRSIFGLDIRGKPKKTAFSFYDFFEELKRTHALPLETLKQRSPTVPDHFFAGAPFKGYWVMTVLLRFFKFQGLAHQDDNIPEDALSFRPYNGPDEKELTWTLGKLILFITSGDKTPVLIENNDTRTAINGARERARVADNLAGVKAEEGLEHLYQSAAPPDDQGISSAADLQAADAERRAVLEARNAAAIARNAAKALDEARKAAEALQEAGNAAAKAIAANKEADKAEAEAEGEAKARRPGGAEVPRYYRPFVDQRSD